MNTPLKAAVLLTFFLLCALVGSLVMQQVAALEQPPILHVLPMSPVHSASATANRHNGDHQNIEWISQIGGNISAVAVQGHYAFAGEDDKLAIFDITDPTAPDVVSRTPALVGGIVDIDVAGDYAYVLGGSEFRVIDVSDPVNPVLKGSLGFTTIPQAIDATESHAYVIGLIGLDIIDVSNPANPSSAVLFSTEMESFDITVVGHFAYVAYGFVYSSFHYGGLQIIDVNDPTAPGNIGGYGTDELAISVAVDGHYAYLATSGGLKIINIAYPAAAKLVGTYTGNTSFGTSSLATFGKYVYGTTSVGDTLEVVDVSNPAMPVEVAWYSLNTPGDAMDVALAEGFAYVANGPGGMVILRYTGDDWAINSFSPTWGPVKTEVVLNGTDFSETTRVRFNGVVASFTIVSDTQLRAIVPEGAKTGKITVFSPKGAAISSADFVVTGGIDTTNFVPVTMR